jgi:hypothetical protein
MAPRSFEKDDKYANLSSLERIVQSPYDGNGSAEVGEFLFEYIQSLIDPERGLGSTFRKLDEGPSDEAIEVFGEKQAESIIETSRIISASGILYGCGWTEGVIRGVRCGRLEKELLLLCLCDHRIARSSDANVIKHVIKDLGLWKMVFDALSRWKLEEKHPRLARCDSINSFTKKQIQSFKCILFIARAATCMKYLEWDFPAISDNASLKTKINECFGTLENLVTVNQKKEEPKKVPIMKAAPVATPIADLGILCFTCEKWLSNNNDYDSNGRLSNASIAPVFFPLDHFGDNDDNPKTNGSDLSRRLRSKDCKIVRFTIFPSEAKEHNATHIRNISRPPSKDGFNKKRSFDKLSSCGVPQNQKPRFSHILFDPKNRSLTSFSENHDEANSGSIHTNRKFSLPNNKATAFSQALFDMKNNCSKNTDERKFVVMPNIFALDTNHVLPPYVSDDSSMHSGSVDPNYWYPVDPQELILNPLQIEMAWLVEESTYCSRNPNIDWIFVMKYASPALQMELRQIPDVVGTDCDKDTLAMLLYDGIEAKRFTVFMRVVRRKLLKNMVRTRMQGILPRMRKATHPLRLQNMPSKNTAVATACAAKAYTYDDLVI